MNKHIERDGKATAKHFDTRNLQNDYATLPPLLKKGMRVLDVGCGTGAISKGIAELVGETGHVTGIDHTEAFITSGKETYKHISNLELLHADIFTYEPKEKFDLIVSARVLQWLSNPKVALQKLKSLLKPGGTVSILDYNHEALEWKPEPPASMRKYYQTFLKWRADAGMNNHIAEDMAAYMQEAGFHSIEVLNADEVYQRGEVTFKDKVAIWSKVAGSRQMVDEGYISDEDRLQAIDEYTQWIETDAERMVMKLKETRGRVS
jgi:ubiquinone/menaquinone biosynthesis C-methylase UbiE